jgi:DNA mismatch repair protein MutS
VHLDATEHGRELIFLHSVRPGPANQSYGLHVAELAGVPRAIVEEARGYLRALERQQRSSLPLSPQQELGFDSKDRSLAVFKERLATIDTDTLSPRAALDLLEELVRLARESSS